MTSKPYLDPIPAGNAPILVCLPFAGGGPVAYREWDAALAPIVVAPVALPGRGTRFDEPTVIDPEGIAASVVDTIGTRPYAVYGHSMGALLGYEVIRVLRKIGAPLPRHFFVGASRPPRMPDPSGGIALLPDKEFLDRLISYGGTPEDILEMPELVELMMPMLRADFTWLHEYRDPADEPLPMPIDAIAAIDDTLVAPEIMDGWNAYTSGGFRQHTIAGDHFFCAQPSAELVALLSGTLV